MIDPSTLPAQNAAQGPAVNETLDANLTTLAGTLRQAAPNPVTRGVGAERECAVGQNDANGALTINLASQPCTVLRDGASATLRLGQDQITLELNGEREWLVVSASGGDHGSVPAVTLADGSSGGYLSLALVDGRELARHIPEDASGLEAMFDALLPPVVPGDDN